MKFNEDMFWHAHQWNSEISFPPWRGQNADEGPERKKWKAEDGDNGNMKGIHKERVILFIYDKLDNSIDIWYIIFMIVYI